MKPLVMITMLLLFLGANFYVFLRLWQLMPAGPAGRTALLIIAGSILLSFLSYIIAGDRMPVQVLYVTYRIGTSWFIILLYLLIIFLLTDAARIFWPSAIREIFHGSWAALGVVAGLITVISLSGYLNYRKKHREEINISVPHGLDEPLKIVAISDLHLGYGIGKHELRKWIELINREKADVVLIAGDLIDTSVRPLYGQNMEEELKTIGSRYGIYAVPGNHEFISGIEKAEKFYADAGITLLRDSTAVVGGKFTLVGRDDRTNAGRKSIETITAGMDRTIPSVLLDHQPYDLEETGKAGVNMQISGHTHRGQVWPISWITDGMFEDSYGLIRKGNTQIYVSSGLGIWGGKFRIGTRSEYLVVNLVPEE